MILELKNIYKDYMQGKMEVHILKDISLSVEKGEYLAIMGPSGSGKTTLMNLIGCLDKPTSGSYFLNGKDILLCMYNANAMSLMDTESALNILVSELGGNNLGETVGEANKATHGEEASWETIVNLNPEYMFVLDRSTAIGSSDEGVLGAKEVVENDLVKEMDVYKNGHIVYFIEHANVWYTSTGGVQALDTMLSDLEGALLVK